MNRELGEEGFRRSSPLDDDGLSRRLQASAFSGAEIFDGPDDDRRAAACVGLSEPMEELVTVHSRHQQIEDHDRRRGFIRVSEATLAVRHRRHRVAELAQRRGDELHRRRIVIDDEDRAVPVCRNANARDGALQNVRGERLGEKVVNDEPDSRAALRDDGDDDRGHVWIEVTRANGT